MYIYALQVHMPTSGILIHYIGWGCLPLTPKKYTVLNGNFGFDLHDIFQERNHGTKWDLPVLRDYHSS